MRRSTMQLTTASLLAMATALAVVVPACGGNSDQPPPTTPATGYQQPPPGYQQPPPGYQQPGAYPQQQPGAYPQQQPGAYPQQPAPTAPGAAPAGTMATPGPLAMPCQADSACLTHRCNTQFGKCAFPCVNAATDCAPGNQCMMGACVPGAPH